MPMYSFTSPNGELYEINGPEGSTKEQAFSILQEGIKNGYYKPKKQKEQEQVDKFYKNFGDKVLGAVDTAGQLIAGMPADIAGGLHGLAKLTSGQGIGEAAKAVEETSKSNFGFGRGALTEKGREYTQNVGELLAKPGQLAGQAAESIGLDPIYGQLPVDAAMNFLPLHGVVKAPGALLKKLEKPQQPTTPIASGQGTIASKLGEMQKPVETPQAPKPMGDNMELLPSNAPQFGIDHSKGPEFWSKDENGIPIDTRASMDVQHVQNPLQRDLFGEEYLPAQGAERNLTQSVDTMLETGRTAQGQFIGDNTMRGLLGDEVSASPELTRAADMDALSMELPKEPSSGKGSPLIGPGRNQAGALDPEVFKQGFRQVNKIISKLTDQPWVRERFPASHYETNKDGSPMILLHATKNAFDERPRVKTTEGLHAGYGYEAPSFFVGSLNGQQQPAGGRQAFHSRTGPHPNSIIEGRRKQNPAIYPLVVRRGNYPRINFDPIEWSPENLYLNDDFRRVLSKLTGKTPDEIHRALTRIEMDVESGPHSSWEVSKAFAEGLKREFNIDGFFYKNKAESLKTELKYRKRVFNDEPFKSRNKEDFLGSKIDENTSFVTWNEENLQSLYGDTPKQFYENTYNPFLKGPGNYQAGGIGTDWMDKVADSIKTWAGKAERSGGAVPPVPGKDSINTPRTQETIEARNALNRKAKAIGETAYDRVTTVEQALAGVSPETDMSKRGNNTLRSGSESVLRTNPKNTIVNFFRTRGQDARNRAETLSKQYVTGKDGLISKMRTVLKDMDQASSVAEALQWGDRNGVVLDQTHFDKLGWNKDQIALYQKVREAMDARYAEMTREAGLQGFDATKPREGYVPSMFDGSYVSFVGFTDKNGRWVTTGIAQGATKWEVNKAIDAYKNMGSKYAESKPVEYRGLKESPKNSVSRYNGFAEMVSRLAEIDPEGFGKAKAIADQHAKDHVRTLMNFDVHELKKSGVRGALGDRPWLTKEQNTREFFAAMVNYLEDGFRYDSMQGFLMDAEKLVNDPNVQRDMPNTASWGRGRIDQLRGNTLGNLGAAMNTALNATFHTLGMGKEVPQAASSWIQATSTAWLMGFRNLGFGLVQLSQPVISGIPEALRIRQATGLSHFDMVDSFKNSILHSPIVASEKLRHLAPEHLQQAWEWGKERGLIDFSEAELVHELNHSQTRLTTKKVINAPIIYSEKLTRPPVFLAYVDMFHKAGFRGEELFSRAQGATDYAMTNYHPDERPAIYSSLGEVGKTMSALSTYKHNQIEQWTSTLGNAKTQPEALIAMLTAAYMFYGVSGLPGYHEANELVKKITGKNVRELILENPDKPQHVMDGLLSWYSDLDWQSKLSMAQVLPDANNPLSVAPHLSKTIDVVGAAYEYAKNQDEKSLRNLAVKGLPTSEMHRYETSVLTDEKGWVSKADGSTAVEQPRTPEQTSARKWFGVKPIQERLQNDNTFTRTQRLQKETERRRDAFERFKSAVMFNDISGMQKAQQDFLDNAGDPKQLADIQKELENKRATPRSRLEGTPNGLGSIYKYQTYEGQR